MTCLFGTIMLKLSSMSAIHVRLYEYTRFDDGMLMVGPVLPVAGIHRNVGESGLRISCTCVDLVSLRDTCTGLHIWLFVSLEVRCDGYLLYAASTLDEIGLLS